MRWYFGFPFVSGFCSRLYELVSLRLAMARFSVITALVPWFFQVSSLDLASDAGLQDPHYRRYM
jgi:hypothetical protein